MLAFKTKEMFGQSILLYDQYYLHNEIANPAFSGLNKYPVINFSYKKQWMNIENAPAIQILSFSQRINEYDFYKPKSYLNKSKFKSKGRAGIGALVFSNTNGPIRNIGGHLKYAYHMPVKSANISTGLSISLIQNTLNQWQFEPGQANDPLLNFKADNLLFTCIDAGVLYSNDEFFAGISFPEVIKFRKNLSKTIGIDQTYFIVSSGYLYKINKVMAFEPSLFIFSNSWSKFNWELYSKIYVKNNWFALSFNYKEHIKTYISFKYNKLNLGYCFSYIFSKISTFNPGNHQLFVGLNVGIKRNEKEGESLVLIFK
ncbi:MAG: PorP/SprF family type IX secretion system membrane protein [Bacteroidales bacterium]|nr:PorP/SprF family type IX secretion system membrane protein [Bacteroidales bacterium]